MKRLRLLVGFTILLAASGLTLRAQFGAGGAQKPAAQAQKPEEKQAAVSYTHLTLPTIYSV